MKNKSPRITFWGTSEFAAKSLQALVSAGYNIIGVVTQPDEPIGRQKILTPPPIKIIAEKLNLPIFQPNTLKNFEKDCPKYDLAVICAYGRIIPQTILDNAKLGNINIHPSLLPKYRGPSPLQTAILNGDKKTGITLILLDKEMDHGPFIAQKEFEIKETETYLDLSEKASEIAADLLIKTLPEYLDEKIIATPQNHSLATFTKLLTREDGLIDWKKPAEEIFNKWRAFLPWPGVWSEFEMNSQKVRIKFIEIKQTEENSAKASGNFLKFSKNKIGTICGDKKIVEVTKLQPEGKKIMSGQEFANGFLSLFLT